MHWILWILREIARRFRLHRREPARRSHRNGQLNPSAPRRKILIANNIRQSGRKNTDLGGEKGDEWGKKWNFGESLLSAKCRWLAESHPYFRRPFPLLAVYFHHFPLFPLRSPSLLPTEMDMFSLDQTPRSPIRPSAERMRRLDITMPPLTRANNDAVKSIPTQ